MDKIRRIPHEGIQPTDSEDGLNVAGTDKDTEGHARNAPGEGVTHLPGTGGDFDPARRPGKGELIDENDVEGHVFNRIPGTGGDFDPTRRPGKGELIDDTDLNGR